MENSSKATLKLKAEDRCAFAEFYRDGECLVIRTGGGEVEKVTLDIPQIAVLSDFIKETFGDLLGRQ